MDAYDLFKKLSLGTKCNFKRYRQDAEKFSTRQKPIKEEKCEVKIEPEKITEKEYNSPLKRKLDHENNEEDNENSFTIMEGMSIPKDGTKTKNKKQKKEMTEEKRVKLQQEKINQFRNEHHISVTGSRVSEPIETFEQLFTSYHVANDLLSNLKNCGYKTPTPIQMQAMPVMLERRQILACAPTGSGKTAAFLLPIIHQLNGPRKKGFRAVILSPTRELSKQTYRECMRLSEGRGFRIHIISKINQALSKYGPTSSKKFDILITTPKRLQFLLNQDPPAISLNNVEWLIVDEADKLFEESTRGFRSQLEEISKACSNINLKRAMFSATNTTIVTKWCRKNLKGLVTITVGQRNAATDLVEQELLYVGNERGKLIAFRNIVQTGLPPPVLIFVQSKERAQELFNELIYDGINVDVIHADRTQTQRDNVVRCFREGQIWVLICTELMSRGIDFKGVNLVINYDFPPSAISYIHRIGRTGRAGHKGKAITFFTQQDTTNLRSIAAVMRASGCKVPDYMLSMKKHSKKERRQLERSAPKRETISTLPKFRKHRNRGKQDVTKNSDSTNNKLHTNEVKEKKSPRIRKNSSSMSNKPSNVGKKPASFKIVKKGSKTSKIINTKFVLSKGLKNKKIVKMKKTKHS